MTLGSFALGVFLGALPFLVYLASRGALGLFLHDSFVAIPRIIDAVWCLPFPDLTSTFRKDLNLHTLSDFFLYEHFRFILNPLVIGIVIVVLVQRAITRSSGRLDVPLATLAAFAILTQRSALGRADFPHQYFSAFLIGPMILILLVLAGRALAQTWRTGDTSSHAFVALTIVMIVPVVAITLWVPDIINMRLEDTTHYLGRVSRVGWIDPAAEEIRDRVNAVTQVVDELSKPGQPFFDFSNQPALYFFCNRPNPTRFYQVPILSPAEYQMETIRALERSKPPLVIRHSPQEFDVFDGIDNGVRAQAVASYINDYYSFARTTRGVEIWQRRKNAPPLTRDAAARYMRAIRIPNAEELGTIGERTRVVFPSAGSLPGANGAYWRSDLTLHNPLKERMPLSLRYVAGDVRIDRAVTILGGNTLRWEDVVRSLFGAPEGSGVLWIEYRGTHPPVARLKTYDAAHDAQGSVVPPLSTKDAASEMMIVGIPGGAVRRINLGIVNIGKVPAEFRVTFRTRTGQQVGEMIDEGLPEDESRMIADIEKALKAPLDETMTVHITVVSGTCVAYASVIDANGDSQLLPAVGE